MKASASPRRAKAGKTKDDTPRKKTAGGAQKRTTSQSKKRVESAGKDSRAPSQKLTERKHPEENLRESQWKFRDLVERLPQVIYTSEIGINGTWEYVSPQIENLLGFSAHEWLADPTNWQRHVHPDDLFRQQKLEEEALKHRKTFEGEYRMFRRDGREIWVRDAGHIHPAQAGGQPIVQGLLTDITAQKQAEEKLHKTKERYRTLFDGMLDGAYRSSHDGRFVDVNPAMVKMFGYDSREQMLALDIKKDMYFSPGERESLFLDTGQEKVDEFRMKRKDGSEIWVEDHGKYIHDQQGNVIYHEGILRNITERKQAEDKLRESNTRLKKVLQVETVGVMFWDLTTGCMTDANDTFLNLMGYSRREVEAGELTWQKLTPPEYVEASLAEVRKFQESGRVGPYEKEYFRKDGSRQWLIFAGSSLGGNACVEFCVDISERKQAEDKLRVSEERYRTLVDEMLDGVYRSTHDGRFVDVNPAMLKLFGYESREQMLALDIKQDLYFTAKERESLFLDTGQEKVDEFRMKRKDGSEIWVEDHGKYIHDQQGNVIYHEGILRNITERKQAEKALRESEARLSLFFNQSLDGFFFSMLEEPQEWSDLIDKEQVLDYVMTHQHITEVNEALIQQYGATRENFIGRTASDFFAHDLEQARAFRRVLFNQGHLHVETEERRDDGAPISVEGDYVCMYDPAGRISGMFGIQRDVTERKEAEEQIRRQVDRLNALRTIGSVINASFDLNTISEVLLEQVLVQLRVDAADILLLDADSLSLRFSAGRGFRSTVPKGTVVRLGEILAGRVALERKFLFASPAEGLHLEGEFAALWQSEGFQTYAGIPLVAKGQVKGVLEVYLRASAPADPSWRDFLETLAGEAAIAIENAQLFERLQRTNLDLSMAYDATIEGWSRAMDLRDHETEGHTQRVTTLTLDLARFMNILDSDLIHMYRGALLHDIGKMSTPDSILFKPGPLLPEEIEIMRKHTLDALNMLAPIDYLRPALDIPYCHHEKWDGTGYPRGLYGVEIPLAARIFAVADVWDALRSDRPYRLGWPEADAEKYIVEQSGKYFDPQVVEAFVQMRRAHRDRNMNTR